MLPRIFILQFTSPLPRRDINAMHRHRLIYPNAYWRQAHNYNRTIRKMRMTVSVFILYKNLAIANRSRISCAHNMSMASTITP